MNKYLFSYILLAVTCNYILSMEQQKSASEQLTITIDYLKNHPDLVKTCASWSFETWGHYQPDKTLEYFIECRQEYLNIDTLPLTLIAFANEVPVGMCSLAHNRGILPELSPWLAALYVHPDYRSRGIGTLLEKAICTKASSMGDKTIYCFSSDKSIIPWYQQHGWSVKSTEWLRNHYVTAMEKNMEKNIEIP